MKSDSFTETKEELTEVFLDSLESMLDNAVESEVIKNFPIVKTGYAILKDFKSLSEYRQKKMLSEFLDTVRYGNATAAQIKAHVNKLKCDPDLMMKEVDYVLFKIDSWSDTEKSRFFGNIYIAYISGRIEWDQLTLFTDILSQLLMYDLETLKDIHFRGKYTEKDIPPFDSMLRLQSLGLVVFHDGYVRQTSRNAISGNVKTERGHITGTGKTFFKLITTGHCF